MVRCVRTIQEKLCENRVRYKGYVDQFNREAEEVEKELEGLRDKRRLQQQQQQQQQRQREDDLSDAANGQGLDLGRGVEVGVRVSVDKDQDNTEGVSGGGNRVTEGGTGTGGGGGGVLAAGQGLGQGQGELPLAEGCVVALSDVLSVDGFEDERLPVATAVLTTTSSNNNNNHPSSPSSTSSSLPSSASSQPPPLPLPLPSIISSTGGDSGSTGDSTMPVLSRESTDNSHTTIDTVSHVSAPPDTTGIATSTTTTTANSSTTTAAVAAASSLPSTTVATTVATIPTGVTRTRARTRSNPTPLLATSSSSMGTGKCTTSAAAGAGAGALAGFGTAVSTVAASIGRDVSGGVVSGSVMGRPDSVVRARTNSSDTTFSSQGLGLEDAATSAITATTATKVTGAISLSTAVAASSTTRQVRRKQVLHVLFSAPLAWRDRSSRLHPLEMLDYATERDALYHVFKEVQRDVSVRFDFATTDSLRTALSFGCRALHFSGHGHESCLNFEDGRSGLQLVTLNTH